ncbi:hypothetical protein Tco_1064666 [Tanacetum coccineum]
MLKLPLDEYSPSLGAPKDRAMVKDKEQHLKRDGFEVEEDLKVLKEHSMDHQEKVPKVDDVSLVDGVFDGALGGDEDDDFSMGEGV